MRFTILITTYNRLEFLKRAIDSALSQTVPCEIIVVDDFSTDGTEEYCKKLGNRIVYCRNKKNSGHSASVNRGVELASGEWIKLVDDDDYLAEDCIKELEKALEKHPSAVICSMQSFQVNKKGEKIKITAKTGPGKVFYIPQEDIHYGMLLEFVPFGTATQVAFKKNAFIKSGGWDSKLDTNFDEIYSWVKIAKFGDAIFINQPLVYRTVWEGGYNNDFSFKKKMETNFLIKKMIYENTNKKNKKCIPKLKDVRNYLRLYWGLVAIKNKAVLEGLRLSFPALYSSQAWKILIKKVLATNCKYKYKNVKKIVLVP